MRLNGSYGVVVTINRDGRSERWAIDAHPAWWLRARVWFMRHVRRHPMIGQQITSRDGRDRWTIVGRA